MRSGRCEDETHANISLNALESKFNIEYCYSMKSKNLTSNFDVWFWICYIILLGLSGGAKAGLVIGVIVPVLVAVAVFIIVGIICCKKHLCKFVVQYMFIGKFTNIALNFSSYYISNLHPKMVTETIAPVLLS